MMGFALNEKVFPYGWIWMGNMEYREGRYSEAIKSFSKYLEISPATNANAAKAMEGIAKCEFAIGAMANPVDFHPASLGPSINSTFDEYWPSLSADETTLVITRLVSTPVINRMQEDFYISYFKDGKWSDIEDAGKPLNTDDNEGAQSISANGRLMVFTACNRSDGIGRCDLYYSVREGDKWSVPLNMGRPVNSTYRETQPSLSSDARTLYFSSDRPGGKGQHDIWVSEMIGGRWTEPVNLGDSVNTEGIEMSPFIHPDNKTLYFASDGHIGMGGYDIYISRLDSNLVRSKAVNMGYPINTNRDEMGLIVNASGNKAYYSSDMNVNNGKDIYVFDIPPESRPQVVTYLKGIIRDADNNSPLRADFELTDLSTGNITNLSCSDSITGEFLVCIPTGLNYMLNVSKKGYLFHSENFQMEGIYKAEKPFLKDIPLEPVKTGVSIILKNIFYDTDSFSLKKESEAELRKIIRFLTENPDIRIEIGGHADNTGSEPYNKLLSENRARTVSEYIIDNGIDPRRVHYKGYGINNPVAPNDTEENKALTED
jgi:flagellar motor protein MotB